MLDAVQDDTDDRWAEWHAINARLMAAEGIEASCEAILAVIDEAIGPDLATIRGFEADADEAPGTRLLGIRGPLADGLPERTLEAVSSAAERVALRDRRRVVIADVAEADGALPDEDAAAFSDAGVTGVVTTPVLSSDGDPLAIVAIGRRSARMPTDRERRLLDLVELHAAHTFERARASARLRSSERTYRSFFDAIDEGFCIIEMLFDDEGEPIDYRFVEANPAFVAQTGLADAVGRTVRELVPDLDAHWYEIYGRIARTGNPERFEQPSVALGRHFDVFAFRIADPEDALVAVLFRDVTTRKATEAALRSLEERQAFMLALSDSLAPLTDVARIEHVAARTVGQRLAASRVFFLAYPDGGVETAVVGLDHAGPGLSSMSGTYRLDDYPALGAIVAAGDTASIDDVWTADAFDEQERARLVVLALRSFIVTSLVRDGRPVGSLVVGSTSARAWRDDERSLVEEVGARTWTAIARARAERSLADIRQRVAREQEVQLVREREARAAAEAFLAVMSHELKTPVTTIYGGAALIARDPSGEEVPDLAGDILDESERLVRIVDDLLVLSRVERGPLELQPEPVLLQRTIDDVLADIRRRYPEADLSEEVPATLPPLLADPTALRQVLYNLLSNAAKYAGGQGPVTSSAEAVDGHVEISVRDRGPGLGPDPEALFRLFFRAPHTARLAPGTGIGLYVARQLATAMGGTLEARSPTDGGATFRLRLPVASHDDDPTGRDPSPAA